MAEYDDKKKTPNLYPYQVELLRMMRYNKRGNWKRIICKFRGHRIIIPAFRFEKDNTQTCPIICKRCGVRIV